MSLLDELNQLAKSIKRFINKSSLSEILKPELTTVSFTEQQSGETIKISVEFIRDQSVVYLLFRQSDDRWKDLTKGTPVCLSLKNVRYNGWAESLTGFDEFVSVLNKNLRKRATFEATYGRFDDDNFQGTRSYRDFMEDYHLIRVKISH